MARLLAGVRTTENKGFDRVGPQGVFGQEGRPMRVAVYARVYTRPADPGDTGRCDACLYQGSWLESHEVGRRCGLGAKDRPGRESLLKAARRREIDVVVVWRLDRWGRSLPDLMVTLRELTDLGMGFVSLTEALDLTTPTGRAMAGMLAVFAEFEREILRERV